VQPPASVDVDERFSDGERCVVFHADGMQSEERDQQSIAHPLSARKGRLAEHLGFALERQVIHQGENCAVFRRMDHAREHTP
jgi:hypothetical protein